MGHCARGQIGGNRGSREGASNSLPLAPRRCRLPFQLPWTFNESNRKDKRREDTPSHSHCFPFLSPPHRAERPGGTRTGSRTVEELASAALLAAVTEGGARG